MAGGETPAAHMSLCHIIGKAANELMHNVCLQGRLSQVQEKRIRIMLQLSRDLLCRVILAVHLECQA